jgi:hypothetical protein
MSSRQKKHRCGLGHIAGMQQLSVPNIAAEWGFVILAHQNLTGHGDFLHDGTFVDLYGGVVGL